MKKLTDEEFIELIINKELEIVNADIRYKDIKKTSKEEQETFCFWEKYSFDTKEDYLEWKDFFFANVYNWLPRSTTKHQIEEEFAWFDLSWGLKSNWK